MVIIQWDKIYQQRILGSPGQLQNHKELMNHIDGFLGRESFFDLSQLDDPDFYKNQTFSLKFIHSIKQIPSFCELEPHFDPHTKGIDSHFLPTDHKSLIHKLQINQGIIKEINESEDGSYNSRQPNPVILENVPTCAEVPTPKKNGGGCNCKKTGCLKMYCECFSSGKTCSEHCSCNNCSNCNENGDVLERARDAAKSKNKFAFDPLDGSNRKHCNCKKTQCQKKYCQCFNIGQRCSELCKCEDCLNGTCNQPHD